MFWFPGSADLLGSEAEALGQVDPSHSRRIGRRIGTGGHYHWEAIRCFVGLVITAAAPRISNGFLWGCFMDGRCQDWQIKANRPRVARCHA
ncbi:hypothetical protein [Roseomonas mucosa]|uniref:hypothetical protein n=1 Tax=Roseomonas mucosa TaxID=207340 RepID=UPI00224000F9|nr:hypothetical protein [Roseomonas mucosa]